MATTFHVKEKSAWKRVVVPQDLLNTEEFDGLIDIQELTDYELVQINNNLESDDESNNKKEKNLKRKKAKEEAALENDTEFQPKAKKKKKNKKSAKNISDAQALEEVTTDEHSCINKKIKKRKDDTRKKEADTTVEKNIQLPPKRKEKKRKPVQNISEDEEPSPASGSLQEPTTELDMSQWANLYVPDVIQRALQEQGFPTPTEIQRMTLPTAIREKKDIFGAAETGSGKTLAFGIPAMTRILEALSIQRKKDKSSIECDEISEELANKEEKLVSSPPMALILEPTRELAVQVKNHLSRLAKYTDIKLATIVGGMSIEKQRRILKKHPHIIIATPGRLWQLVEEGDDHLSQIDKILCLIVDEADRMVEKGHYEELTKIMELLNNSPRRVKNRQTFVMSATLTMDVAIPKRLNSKKKHPKKDLDKLKSLTERICAGLKPKVIDLTPKDKVAQTLTEIRVNCNADEKDYYLYYFLCQHPGRTLVFANSKDCLRRLVALFTLLKCSPLPLHADMHQRQRLKNLDKFSECSQALLIASDVAARGLDIPKVDHVIHYQVPRTMENYIHRSGRTARASNLGLSVMLVGPEDAKDYRKIVHGVRNGEELPMMPVEVDLFPAVKIRVNLARNIDVKEYRLKKKRLRNNFFTKAAQEMDMIVDDDRLLEDLGDSVQQAQDKQQLQQMKAQLEAFIRCPLAPLRMSKYPTKSGQLILKKSLNLFDKKISKK
ncbi:ATP-dependent RNA helicase DDX24-like isoform X2 [Biomphalaria glabrata]|uniref:RNA helicase n=1 Tax=Biomphalaria glabrata TaxID=6526 RepID=A0A9U8E6Y2_BIOGL|nr:ATP-dependent RNA helicase DDX24-like isoform X2 [Biomphalaria glabrata]